MARQGHGDGVRNVETAKKEGRRAGGMAGVREKRTMKDSDSITSVFVISDCILKRIGLRESWTWL